jgi:hypothetical protein
MSREELKTALKAGEGKQPEVRDVANGKAFVAELDKCKTPEDIYALLTKNMDSKTLADRVSLLQKNYHDNDLIVALENRKARCNAELGFRTSHEAKVIMAAGQYQKLKGTTGHSVKDFKKGLTEYAAKHTVYEKTDAQKIASQLLINRGR